VKPSSFVLPTVDTLMAAFGLAAVTYPGVAVVNAFFGSPLAPGTVRLLVGVVAVGGAYPFVAGDWSLGRLGTFLFAFTASLLLGGLLAFAVFLALGTSLDDGTLAQTSLVAVAYVAAYALVYRGGADRLRRAVS
jgi:hypothetical protein